MAILTHVNLANTSNSTGTFLCRVRKQAYTIISVTKWKISISMTSLKQLDLLIFYPRTSKEKRNKNKNDSLPRCWQCGIPYDLWLCLSDICKVREREVAFTNFHNKKLHFRKETTPTSTERLKYLQCIENLYTYDFSTMISEFVDSGTEAGLAS